MRISKTALGFVGAAAAMSAGVAGSAVAAKPAPNQNQTLTITASPNPVVYSRTAVLAGRLSGSANAGVNVTLQSNPYPFTGFKPAATVTTDSTGHYAFTVRPGLNTRYRASAATKPGPNTTSTEVLEQVRTRVTLGLSTYHPRRGQVVRFSGSVYPAHDGGLVAIQRRLSTGAYSTITRVRLAHVIGANRSSYSKRLRVYRTGTFRVVLGSHADHARGVSSTRTARVG